MMKGGFLITLGVSLALVTACARVPITGRKQIQMIPSSEVNAMALQSYREFLSGSKLSSNQQQTRMVKEVGEKIKDAVTGYMTRNRMADDLKGYDWEFNLVENEEVNAWAMPGGKVVFYNGIMPFCRDKDGIAVVMGHEIAHVIARHGNERLSQALLAEMGGIALNVATMNKPDETRQMFLLAYGIGATLGVMLPYSRLHEREADRIGLIIMTMAGFDPNRAITFWQEMEKEHQGATIPAFLSTHPSHETRIEEIRKTIPEALRYAGR